MAIFWGHCRREDRRLEDRHREDRRLEDRHREDRHREDRRHDLVGSHHGQEE